MKPDGNAEVVLTPHKLPKDPLLFFFLKFENGLIKDWERPYLGKMYIN